MIEIWKDIVGFEGFYMVSNKANVKSLDRVTTNNQTASGRILKKCRKNGYLKVALCKDNSVRDYYVHRLVASAFIENPSLLPMVNHKNGVRTDNRPENLEWVSKRENLTHGILLKRGKGISPGVHINKINAHKKWKATIYINGRNKFIGNFYTEIEAAMAYRKALNEIGVSNRYAV